MIKEKDNAAEKQADDKMEKEQGRRKRGREADRSR